MPFIWEKRPACGDYACNLHGQHAADCDRPDIDTFRLLGIDPVPAPKEA